MTVDQDTLRLTPVAAIPFPIRAVWLAMALMICSAGQAQVIDTSTAPGGPSTYVAIDSWVYPALDRLAADGYVETAFSSLRPWTRNECARLTQEAEDQMDERAAGSDARRLLDALQREFAPELGDSDPARPRWQIESVDQRTTVIAGRPLTDGFHFAETLTDDEGRPFGRGVNLYSGVSVRGSAGPFAGSIRTEFQRAAAAPAPDAFAQQRIAAADFTSPAAAGPISGIARGRVLEGYVAFGFANNQLTFGRQSLWWGPARSGATLFSNNAEPIDMLRYDRVRPFLLPGFLRIIGPLRAQLLIGRLSGTQFLRATSTLYGRPGFALGDQPFCTARSSRFIRRRTWSSALRGPRYSAVQKRR
ncbi:MAG TPA: capsule assembly Wzi family protein [Acidobacteriaceae bacterium]|nr:capsule assembly Wzi family protein [Acidobacteriaceae bacterium]